MAKKVMGMLKLQVAAGNAKPSPPVGPALGQRGINIMEFCKAFNAKTADMEKDAPCPTVITYYADKSFTFEIKTPPRVLLHQEGGQAGVRVQDPRPCICRFDHRQAGA